MAHLQELELCDHGRLASDGFRRGSITLCEMLQVGEYTACSHDGPLERSGALASAP